MPFPLSVVDTMHFLTVDTTVGSKSAQRGAPKPTCSSSRSHPSMSLLSVREIPSREQFEFLCTSGRPFVLRDVRIVKDGTTEVLENGEDAGEIRIRGPTVFSGSWRNPEATRKSFTSHGWFRIGDLAVRHKSDT